MQKFLHLDMGQTKELVVPLGRIFGKVLPHRTLNVTRGRLVSLDEIRVVAVHLPDDRGKRLQYPWGVHMSGEAPGSFEDLAGELRKTWISTLGHQGLHGTLATINLWNAH